MKFSNKTLLRIVTITTIAILTVAFLSACGKQEEAEELPVVEALPQGRPEMKVERDGVIPCGLGNVTQWGYQTIRVNDFPICTNYFPSLEVYCLNAEAQWTEENVTIVSINKDKEEMTVDFRQEGICGIFPILDLEE